MAKDKMVATVQCNNVHMQYSHSCMFDDFCFSFISCFISNLIVFCGSFLGPILLIIIFNAVVFIIIVVILVRHYVKRNLQKGTKAVAPLKKALKMIFSLLGVMFLLGLSWILSLFTVLGSKKQS